MLFQCRCRIVNEQILVPVVKRVCRVKGGSGGLYGVNGGIGNGYIWDYGGSGGLHEVNGGIGKGIYGVMGVVECCMRLTGVLETGIYGVIVMGG